MQTFLVEVTLEKTTLIMGLDIGINYRLSAVTKLYDNLIASSLYTHKRLQRR